MNIKLWKKDNKGKWYSYSGVFVDDKNSLSYQRVVRLVATQGWQAYYEKQVPGVHQPIAFENLDYSKLTEYIKKSDPVGYSIGNSMREFLADYGKNQPKSDQFERLPPESLKLINEKAFQIALDRYKQNLPIPSFLCSKIERYLFGEKS